MRTAKSIQWLKCLVIACSVLAMAYLGEANVLSVKAAEVVASGNCGKSTNTGGESSVTWSLDDEGVLTISGTGEMKDYSFSESSKSPWFDYAQTMHRCTTST